MVLTRHDLTMKVVYSSEHRLHAPLAEFEKSQFQAPFEHAGRAEFIHAALAADPNFEIVAPDVWGTDPIEAVHDPGLVRFLANAWDEYQVECGPTHDVVPDVFRHPGVMEGMGPGREPGPVAMRIGWWCYETTTPLTEGTYAAARASVDVALTATDAVLRAGERAAYGLCRPPGHHAARAVYGGYCFFNNAAVAAHHAAASTGSKVAVLDVDYHHGNGTQQIFYDRADVLYVSVHADPARAYPYVTGFADETGSGAGIGANLNLPLAAGADDAVVLSTLARAAEAIDRFGADMVIVSLGLDMYEHDPIADLRVTADGFAASGRLVGALGKPTVVLQEGGYAAEALGTNARAWLNGLRAS
jgi:acetoin utilization deacetylase AcuC-like enzyme